MSNLIHKTPEYPQVYYLPYKSRMIYPTTVIDDNNSWYLVFNPGKIVVNNKTIDFSSSSYSIEVTEDVQPLSAHAGYLTNSNIYEVNGVLLKDNPTCNVSRNGFFYDKNVNLYSGPHQITYKYKIDGFAVTSLSTYANINPITNSNIDINKNVRYYLRTGVEDIVATQGSPESDILLAEINFIYDPLPEDIDKIDLREYGFMNQTFTGEDNFKWNVAYWNGIPFQGNYVYIIYLPETVLINMKNQIKEEYYRNKVLSLSSEANYDFNEEHISYEAHNRIMDKLYKHAPLGSYIILAGYKRKCPDGSVEIVKTGVE